MRDQEGLRFRGGLHAEARAAAPQIAESLAFHDRHIAARAAILAGSCLADESAALDQAERCHWLERARDWIRDDVAAWTKTFETGSTPERVVVRMTLAKLQIEPEIAWLHKHDRSANLSPAERHKSDTLWSDVAKLFKRALDVR